ncbi:hypothetical protein PR202_ga16365 [Eleusine coracana subsp. coracana]|uniref:BZIP domain-containing protein n=1 Tax=Eleusine coracana subsp. coracana TaxID=191504 RepID=A0AAV5CLH6_ELECO|nr:hypothetical protein QOZ80_6AG0529450 [Eleusine coracana subsp. coracana]GJM99277.1 hypothetical protein PR202_ga16365 [Eleusine coracana subsp. coracana]
MDEDRGNPARRRLPSPPGGHQGQGQPPRGPTDLFSQFQRRFSQSLLLPPMVPRLPSAASGSGSSAFSYYQGMPALAPPAAGAAGGSHLTRCLSQPPFFPTDQLAPLPYALPVSRSPLSPGAAEQGGPSALPPRGAGHRRSRSDFPFASPHPNMSLQVPPSVDAAALESVFGSYRVMGTLGSVVSGAAEERHDHARGWSPTESRENEAENWVAAAGPSNPRHCRSLSVDSFMAGNLNFGGMGQESQKMALPSPAAGTSIGLSRAGSGPSDGPSAFFATTDLANGEFSEDDRKKIMSNDRLAEMAMTDPKRVKRILANRVSAAKSKERKVRYMGELERRVRVLQMETSALSAKMEREQRESDALKTQNNEMRIRVQALEQQAQLKNALNEAMSAEVQRLKHAIGEASGDPRGPNGSHQHMGCQMTPQQLLQLQKQQSEAQLELAPQQQPQE